MPGGQNSCADDACEVLLVQRQVAAEHGAVQGLVDALAARDGEHPLGDVERLDMGVAEDPEPFAGKPGAGTRVEDRRRAPWQVPRQ